LPVKIGRRRGVFDVLILMFMVLFRRYSPFLNILIKFHRVAVRFSGLSFVTVFWELFSFSPVPVRVRDDMDDKK
jgi:hypothetical protein